MPCTNFKDLVCPAEPLRPSGSAGRASAWKAERHGFESRPRQLFFFSWKKELSSGIVACICLVSITDLYMYMYVHMLSFSFCCARDCSCAMYSTCMICFMCSIHTYMYMCAHVQDHCTCTCTGCVYCTCVITVCIYMYIYMYLHYACNVR